MISQSRYVSTCTSTEVDEDEEDGTLFEPDNTRRYPVASAISGNAGEVNPLQLAKRRLKSIIENHFVNEILSSISHEALDIKNESDTEYSANDGQQSEFSYETEEDDEEEPQIKPLKLVEQAVQSWKSEINNITKLIAEKQARKSKSRTEQWLKYRAKAEAERDRVEKHEAKFFKYVESSGDTLTSNVKLKVKEPKPISEQEMYEFDMKYRPMRLIKLNDLDDHDLNMENMYKTTLGRLSKNTACWITSTAEDTEVQAKLQKTLEEVHGQVNPEKDFWNPEVIENRKNKAVPIPSKKQPHEVSAPEPDVAEDEVPALITSRTVKETNARESEQEKDTATSTDPDFQEFKSKIFNRLETLRSRGRIY